MQSTTFNLIKSKLTNLINDKNAFITSLNKKPKVSSWKIEELQENVKKARKLLSEEDKFFTSDLYHIISMGKLTVTQSSELLKLTKDLGSDRSTLKSACTLTANNDFVFNIKDFQKDVGQGVYKSSLLNITLKQQL